MAAMGWPCCAKINFLTNIHSWLTIEMGMEILPNIKNTPETRVVPGYSHLQIFIPGPVDILLTGSKFRSCILALFGPYFTIINF